MLLPRPKVARLSLATQVTVASGATLGVTAAATINDLQGAGTVNLGAVPLTVQAGSFGGAITGTGSLTKSTAGTLVLSGTNSYGGATNINSGTLQAGAADTLFASSAHTVSAGAALDLNNFNQTIGSLAGAGNVTLGSATLTAGGDNTSTTFSGVISGGGGLAKTGTGTVTLTGANSYSGGTTVSAGTLQGNTASLQGNIVNNAAVTFDQATTGTYAGSMSGSGSLTKQNAGTLILTGTNSYSGGTTVSAGTLQAGAANTLSASSAHTVSAGATLDLNNFNQTIGSLAGAGNVTLGSATLTAGGRQHEHDLLGRDLRRRWPRQAGHRHARPHRHHQLFRRHDDQWRSGSRSRAAAISSATAVSSWMAAR